MKEAIGMSGDRGTQGGIDTSALRAARPVSLHLSRNGGAAVLRDGDRYYALSLSTDADHSVLSVQGSDGAAWTVYEGNPNAAMALLEDIGSRRRRAIASIRNAIDTAGRWLGRAATPLAATAIVAMVLAVQHDRSTLALSNNDATAVATAALGETRPPETGAVRPIERTPLLATPPEGDPPMVALPSPSSEMAPASAPSSVRPSIAAQTVGQDEGGLPIEPNDPVEASDLPVTVPGQEPFDVAVAAAEVEAIQSALSRLRRGEMVPSDIVERLPHDVASSLKELGAIPTPEETATLEGRTLVRLPASVRRSYVDEFGLPTVPAADTWTSLGGGLRIPLPGGGDISSVEDLEVFGLEP